MVKYFHPGFLSRDVNWDSAAVVVIPRVLAARTSGEYKAAVDAMLSVLADPQTKVTLSATNTPRTATAPQVRTRWEADSTLIVSIPSFESPGAVARQMTAVTSAVRVSRRVVFDLRGPSPDEVGYAGTIFDRQGVSALLASHSLTGPGFRRRMYYGFATQFEGRNTGQGSYWTAAYETPGFPIYADAPTPKRVAFVINESSDVPEVAWALQRVGAGSIILDGAQNTVRHALGGIGWRLVDFVPIGEGFEVQVRTGEMVGPSGGPLAADTVIRSTADDDGPVRAALAYVRGELGNTGVARSGRPPVAVGSELAYRDMRYPELPYRVLAAYKWWAAIQYFYPHKAGMGEEVSAALGQSVMELQAARDSTEYRLAVAKMRARIRDSHYNNPDVFGAGAVALVLRYVEGAPVVVAIGDDPDVATSGIAVGDIVESVDGESAAARKARFAPYISASTPQSLDQKLAGYLLKGPVESVAEVLVLRSGGSRHRVMLPRRATTRTPNAPRQFDDDGNPVPRAVSGTVPAFRIEPGNVGYVDLRRLTLQTVDTMFATLQGTTGIVFDMRGYPAAELRSALASRLSDGMEVPPHDIQVVLSPDSSARTWQRTARRRIGPSPKGQYRGKTVLLIDERAQSAAEEMGLWLEAANGTTFIGSPTAGADGGITSVVLPGGIRANFTGSVMLHADGRPIQRVGLVPAILVRPTIAGVRAGRDEVLERALAFLRNGR